MEDRSSIASWVIVLTTRTALPLLLTLSYRAYWHSTGRDRVEERSLLLRTIHLGGGSAYGIR